MVGLPDAPLRADALERLVAFTEAKREMLRVLLHRHHDARVLIFTADNESVYAVARTHLIMPFTCDIGRREREEALGRFRHGMLRARIAESDEDKPGVIVDYDEAGNLLSIEILEA